jgi:hypothetical protein
MLALSFAPGQPSYDLTEYLSPDQKKTTMNSSTALIYEAVPEHLLWHLDHRTLTLDSTSSPQSVNTKPTRAEQLS